MKINKDLHLVTSVEGEKGKVHIHATPIAAEVFDLHWKVLSQTFSNIHTQGLAMVGARHAYRMLKDVAQQAHVWEGTDRNTQYVKTGLLAEMHRLTNVMSIGAKGYEMMPFDDAVAAGILDAEDVSEVEGKLTFFTASYHNYTKATRQEFLASALEIWDAQISPLGCTDYLNFLRTSTAPVSSGKSAT